MNGQLEANGKRFFVKGLSWGGLETEARQLGGLDQMSARDLLDTLKGLGFNAVSIKISTTMGLDLDGAVRKETADADLAGLSAGQVLHKVVSMAGERGIQVVLDMARIDETQPAPDLWCVRALGCSRRIYSISKLFRGAALLPTIHLTFLPLPYAGQTPNRYDGRHTTDALIQAWHNVLNHVKSCGNVMGVNLKSSCHGRASWGNSNPSFDWCVRACVCLRWIAVSNNKRSFIHLSSMFYHRLTGTRPASRSRTSSSTTTRTGRASSSWTASPRSVQMYGHTYQSYTYIPETSTNASTRPNSQAGNIDVDCRSSHPSFWGGNLQVSERVTGHQDDTTHT